MAYDSYTRTQLGVPDTSFTISNPVASQQVDLRQYRSGSGGGAGMPSLPGGPAGGPLEGTDKMALALVAQAKKGKRQQAAGQQDLGSPESAQQEEQQRAGNAEPGVVSKLGSMSTDKIRNAARDRWGYYHGFDPEDLANGAPEAAKATLQRFTDAAHEAAGFEPVRTGVMTPRGEAVSSTRNGDNVFNFSGPEDATHLLVAL
jgi:hypothetical protein